MKELLPYFAISVVAAGVIGTWSVLKYKVSQTKKETDTNTSNISELIKVIGSLTSDIKLLTGDVRNVKEGLDKNDDKDAENSRKIDEFRKEIYNHTAKMSEKLESKIDKIRDKLQEIDKK